MHFLPKIHSSEVKLLHVLQFISRDMGKRKRGDSVRKTRQKKRLQSDEKRVNPFEVRVNRKKHDVLGQRSKSDRGLPGVSRSKAIQKVHFKFVLQCHTAVLVFASLQTARWDAKS